MHVRTSAALTIILFLTQRAARGRRPPARGCALRRSAASPLLCLLFPSLKEQNRKMTPLTGRRLCCRSSLVFCLKLRTHAYGGGGGRQSAAVADSRAAARSSLDEREAGRGGSR
jgi:hypothetical protein